MCNWISQYLFYLPSLPLLWSVFIAAVGMVTTCQSGRYDETAAPLITQADASSWAACAYMALCVYWRGSPNHRKKIPLTVLLSYVTTVPHTFLIHFFPLCHVPKPVAFIILVSFTFNFSPPHEALICRPHVRDEGPGWLTLTPVKTLVWQFPQQL